MAEVGKCLLAKLNTFALMGMIQALAGAAAMV